MRRRFRGSIPNGVLGSLAILALPLGSIASQAVSVGANVHVSADRASNWHGELWAAADWVSPDKLIVCGVTQRVPADRQLTGIFYASRDRGKTWKTTLESYEGHRVNTDPVCEFGLNGTAYALILAIGGVNPPTVPATTTNADRQTLVYRSADGGFAWSTPSRIEFVDRQGLAVDRTGGKYHGRVYIQGVSNLATVGTEQPHAVALLRSLDGGVTFQPSVTRQSAGERWVHATGNTVVLPDGTVVFPAGVQLVTAGPRIDTRTRGLTLFFRSTDGGETLAPPVTIAEMFPGPIATIDVDRSSGPFKGRIYAAWSSGHQAGYDVPEVTAVFLAHSDDGGLSWSKARPIDDTPPRSDVEPDFPGHVIQDLSQPVVKVNKDGVVGITWYDRRDVVRGLGWDLRFIASFDGGDTFVPSTKVNTEPAQLDDRGAVPIGLGGRYSFSTDEVLGTKDGVSIPVGAGMNGGYFYSDPGHTNGMAVGVDGTFHAFWVDNRTGFSQVWTAPVEVRGPVLRHGSRDLASFTDVSDKVALAVAHEGFDRASGTLRLGIRVRNKSKETLRGPIKLRLVGLTSRIGRAAPSGAENAATGVGAIWDFSSALENGMIGPGKESRERFVTFVFKDARFIQPSGQVPFEFAEPTFRVLAGAIEK